MSEDLQPVKEEEPEDHREMTDEQWAWFQEYTHGYGDQDENGVDLSLLRSQLSLTPTERLMRLEAGAEFVKELDSAGAKARISRSH